jgi:hypothetical protein
MYVGIEVNKNMLSELADLFQQCDLPTPHAALSGGGWRLILNKQNA